MQPHEYARMAATEQHHWWFVGKRDLVARLVGRHFPSPRTLTVLDAGCGTGQTLADLSTLGTCVGADHDLGAAEITRGRGIARVVQADCQRPPFAPARLDLVLLLDTLEHVPDDVGALRRLGELLRPTGRLVVSVPAYPCLFGAHDRALGHRRRYTRRDLMRAVRRAGLRVCQLTGYNTGLLPLIAVWRVLSRVARSDDGRSDVNIDLPGWVNRLLTGLVRLENRFNSRGSFAPSLTLVAVLAP